MTHEKKIKYFTVALNICKFGFTEEQVDLMVSVYDKVLEKEGETSLDDIFKIKVDVEKRFIEQNTPKTETDGKDISH